ncbi:MAG: peptidylprolyl isomerase [Methylophilaceae bacterium]|jgi:peptidyl-prolyl cis-trans isomerase C
MKILPIFSLLLLTICTATKAEISITVNEQHLNPTLIEFISKELELQGKEITDEMKKNITERLIELEIMTDAARKKGITNESKFLSKVELTYMELAYTEYLKKYLLDHPISKDDIKKEYDAFKKKFDKKEFKGQHILVKTKNEAEMIHSRIKKGEQFDEIAKNLSLDKESAKNGGDLGWFKDEDMVDSFSAEAHKLKPTEVSDAFQTQFGWHILKINEIKKRPPPDLETVKKQIEETLKKRKLTAHIKELKDNAEINR